MDFISNRGTHLPTGDVSSNEPMLLFPKRTFQPSTIRRKRNHGFFSRSADSDARLYMLVKQSNQGWEESHCSKNSKRPVKDNSLASLPPATGEIKSEARFIGEELCILWDHRGHIVYAASKKLDTVDPSEGEVLALLLGISVVVDYQWEDVVFEGDSLIVMDAISNLIEVISQASFLLRGFANAVCRFTPRGSSVLAHNLARWAASFLWEGSFPEILEVRG
ncbi:hypothetical protein CJ030_MR3G026285 [Morella rubra]|uniref:RNase H type-1 domain-containing protein n=1 Tax=Morella rubra TaxID=262757 RepID=A0A6A1W004_9ROSI|nr:hypothetical protein CJ030_MR3G026285 [Morella rubra]